MVEFHQMSRHQTRDKYLVWWPTDAVAHAVSSNFFGDASQELSFFEDTAILWQCLGALKGATNGDESLSACGVFFVAVVVSFVDFRLSLLF